MIFHGPPAPGGRAVFSPDSRPFHESRITPLSPPCTPTSPNPVATFQHPASLSALQQFRQACAILRKTSRAGNPAWYQEALDLDFQFHVRPDGSGVTSYYFDRRKDLWHDGPALTDEALHDPAQLEALALEALRTARSQGAKSLGVVLHIADEFATTELKQELDNPAALPDLRGAAVADPKSILADSSIQADHGSWRVLPYPAASGEVIATTVTVSRQYATFTETLRKAGEEANFPIITQAVSAPLVALIGLGRTLQPTGGKPFVAILQYPWLTALAFFNEHADLRLIRTLQHRGLRRPTNFRNSLATTNASLEFVEPDLFIVPLGAGVDESLPSDLQVTFPHSRVEKVLPAPVNGLPEWAPEPAIAAGMQGPSEDGIRSHTFTVLRDEKWALQDFLPTPRDIVEIYPSRAEMAMLRGARLARVAVFGVAALFLAYFAFGILSMLRQPEWAFDPSQADAAKARLTKFGLERKKTLHWGNLLEDRSKAWSNMESLARMVPKNGGMLVKTYNHQAKPETMAGTATAGFIREWKITGLARDEALDYLNTLNTREGIAAHFTEIARVTGNSAFNPAIGNRSLVVNVRTQENPGFKPVPPEEANVADESTYPFTFDLTITQRFEATDPLALNVTKAP